jgi:hypothetical protein
LERRKIKMTKKIFLTAFSVLFFLGVSINFAIAHPIINGLPTLLPSPLGIPVGGFVNPVNFNLNFSVTNADNVEIGINDYNFTIFEDDWGLTGFDDILGTFAGNFVPIQIPVGGTAIFGLGPFIVPAATLNAAVDNIWEGDFLEPFAKGTLSWFEKEPPFDTGETGFNTVPEPCTLLLLCSGLKCSRPYWSWEKNAIW